MIDDKTLKHAAGWIYRNRHTGFWTSPILVADLSKTPEVQALRLTFDDAESVFTALEEKGFLTKIEHEKLGLGNSSFQKYRIDVVNLRDFRRFSEVPFYYFLPDSWIYYLEKYWSWFVVCIALIVTSFLNGFVGALGKWIGEKLTK